MTAKLAISEKIFIQYGKCGKSFASFDETSIFLKSKNRNFIEKLAKMYENFNYKRINSQWEFPTPSCQRRISETVALNLIQFVQCLKNLQ